MDSKEIGVVLAVLIIIVCGIAWRRRARQKRLSSPGLAIFVSGCDTGIGRALATLFDGLGCDVFAGCLEPTSAKTSLPDAVTVVPLDVTSESSVQEALQSVQSALAKKGKGLWSVVNNAGVCVYGEFAWLTWAQCEAQVQVNLLGTMRLTRAFLPLLRRSAGRLVTITSVNGSLAYPGLAVYSATKFALEGLLDALRLELRRQGVRVVSVQPGDLARLTAIMARHEAHARDMWAAMAPGDREGREGSYFRRYHRVALRNYGLTSPGRMEDSPLLGDVTEAVLGLEPRDRYLSAPLHFRLVYRLLVTLPKCVTDWILGRMTDYVLRSGKEADLTFD